MKVAVWDYDAQRFIFSIQVEGENRVRVDRLGWDKLGIFEVVYNPENPKEFAATTGIDLQDDWEFSLS